jgi:hypothetical protein
MNLDTRINTYIKDYQLYSSITALNDGGFVVSWTSARQDGSVYGIYAQRYDANGVKKGDEFQVNTNTNGSQENSSITALNDGGFVASWASERQDSSGYGIYAQRYDANGVKKGNEFQISSFTSSGLLDSSITALKDESARLFRRLFCLSQAASADSSSWR